MSLFLQKFHACADYNQWYKYLHYFFKIRHLQLQQCLQPILDPQITCFLNLCGSRSRHAISNLIQFRNLQGAKKSIQWPFSDALSNQTRWKATLSASWNICVTRYFTIKMSIASPYLLTAMSDIMIDPLTTLPCLKNQWNIQAVGAWAPMLLQSKSWNSSHTWNGMLRQHTCKSTICKMIDQNGGNLVFSHFK